MARQLGISDERIGIAGIKDKRAITTQLMSIRGIAAEDLERITLPRVSVTPLGRSNKDIAPGDLKGNDFDILISGIDISPEETEKRIIGDLGRHSVCGRHPQLFRLPAVRHPEAGHPSGRRADRQRRHRGRRHDLYRPVVPVGVPGEQGGQRCRVGDTRLQERPGNLPVEPAV